MEEDDEHVVYLGSTNVVRILGPTLFARNRVADRALAPLRLAQAEERLKDLIRRGEQPSD